MDYAERDGDLTDKALAKKAEFQEPELTYVKPTLVEFGKVADLTQQGYFGTFYP